MQRPATQRKQLVRKRRHEIRVTRRTASDNGRAIEVGLRAWSWVGDKERASGYIANPRPPVGPESKTWYAYADMRNPRIQASMHAFARSPKDYSPEAFVRRAILRYQILSLEASSRSPARKIARAIKEIGDRATALATAILAAGRDSRELLGPISDTALDSVKPLAALCNAHLTLPRRGGRPSNWTIQHLATEVAYVMDYFGNPPTTTVDGEFDSRLRKVLTEIGYLSSETDEKNVRRLVRTAVADVKYGRALMFSDDHILQKITQMVRASASNKSD